MWVLLFKVWRSRHRRILAPASSFAAQRSHLHPIITYSSVSSKKVCVWSHCVVSSTASRSSWCWRNCLIGWFFFMWVFFSALRVFFSFIDDSFSEWDTGRIYMNYVHGLRKVSPYGALISLILYWTTAASLLLLVKVNRWTHLTGDKPGWSRLKYFMTLNRGRLWVKCLDRHCMDYGWSWHFIQMLVFLRGRVLNSGDTFIQQQCCPKNETNHIEPVQNDFINKSST